MLDVHLFLFSSYLLRTEPLIHDSIVPRSVLTLHFNLASGPFSFFVLPDFLCWMNEANSFTPPSCDPLLPPSCIPVYGKLRRLALRLSFLGQLPFLAPLLGLFRPLVLSYLIRPSPILFSALHIFPSTRLDEVGVTLPSVCCFPLLASLSFPIAPKQDGSERPAHCGSVYAGFASAYCCRHCQV